MILPPYPIKLYFVALATLFLVVACKPATVFTDKDYPCQNETLLLSPSPSTPLDIALHVDGSGSMLGYVTIPNSRYIRTLESLDTILTGQGPRDNQTLKYYRSGGTENQTLNRQEYRKATTSEFYDGTLFPKVSSQLDKAITSPNQNDKILVFVTDLDQNDGDFSNLVDQIDKTYLRNQSGKYSVGILAIKSEFKGTVYTTEPQNYADFKYNTEGKNKNKYRPFYVIMIGNKSDINYYYEQLKKQDEELIKEIQFVIFSADNMVKEITSPKNSQPLPNDINSPKSLQSGRVVFEPSTPNQSPYTFLEIPKGIETKQITIPYTLNLSLSDHHLTPTPSMDITNIQVSNSLEKKFIDQSNNNSLKQALQISDLNLTGQNLTFNTQILPESLSEPGIYLFTVDLTTKDLQTPDWWEKWDWGSQQDSHQTNKQDGSKTYHLKDFMTTLKNRLTDGNKSISLGRFCYAIQKD